MKRFLLAILITVFFTACGTDRKARNNETETETAADAWLSLYEAIEQAAENIVAQIPAGSRVAIVAFESEHDNLSEFIMEELTGELFDRGIEVADRQNLEFVYRELNFQMGGDVSDETAQSIGKFLGAQLVITGQLVHVGNSYRYRSNAVHVEQAARASVTRLTVRDDDELRDMVAALAGQTNTVTNSRYAVSDQTAPKSAGTFLDRGILFAVRSDYEMAIADFTEALNIDPELSAMYLLRGRAIYASASNVTNVGDNFSSVGTSVSDSAATAEQVRSYDLAIADYTRALRLDPDNDTIYIERGNAHRDKGDNDRAIADFNQAIQLNPERAYAYLARGLAYRAKGDNDRTIADYDQALRLNPGYSTAYYNRGNAYRAKGDNDSAIADYDQALRLDPNYAAAYVGRGLAYRAKEDNDSAIADYDQALRLNPTDAIVYNNRGNVYWAKGNNDSAIADYNQAIRLNPNYANAYNNRGIAYRTKGDNDRAIADYNQAIRLNPGYVSAYYNRGNAYRAKGDNDRAIADFSQVIRLNPNYANAYYNRGNAYRAKGDNDSAIADFSQVIRLNPNDANAYNNRGISYRDKGDLVRAIADYEAALRIDPNNTTARQNLETARQQQQQRR